MIQVDPRISTVKIKLSTNHSKVMQLHAASLTVHSNTMEATKIINISWQQGIPLLFTITTKTRLETITELFCSLHHNLGNDIRKHTGWACSDLPYLISHRLKAFLSNTVSPLALLSSLSRPQTQAQLSLYILHSGPQLLFFLVIMVDFVNFLRQILHFVRHPNLQFMVVLGKNSKTKLCVL